jgi:hypothetical protein
VDQQRSRGSDQRIEFAGAPLHRVECIGSGQSETFENLGSLEGSRRGSREKRLDNRPAVAVWGI